MRTSGLALLGVLLAGLGLRLVLVLTHDNYLGVDGGAYLLTVNQVLGDEPTGAGFAKPPLAPGWLLVPFVSLWGGDIGYKIWSALASLLPIIPVYLLTREFASSRAALAAAAFISVDVIHAEVLVTGALPLIGFAIIGMVVWAIVKFLDPRPFHEGRTNFPWALLWLILIAIPLVAFVNQTSAGLMAIVVPVLLIGIVVFAPKRGTTFGPLPPLPSRFKSAPVFLSPVLLPLGAGGLLALGALPWYLDVAPNSPMLHYPGSWIYFRPWYDIGFLQFALALPVAWWAIRHQDDCRLKAVAAILIALSVLNLFFSTDETIINIMFRAGLLWGVFFYPLAAWIFARYWWPKLDKPVAWAVLLAFLGLAAYGYAISVPGQARYSDMITTDTIPALDYLREEHPGEGIMASAYSMSLWVAALNKVPSPHPWTLAPPRAYAESDRHVRCVLGWIESCDPLASAEELGIRHVLLDTRFPEAVGIAGVYGAPPDQWRVTAEAPWLKLVYAKGTTRLWVIKG